MHVSSYFVLASVQFCIDKNLFASFSHPFQNFTIESVNMFDDFLFDELLEMLDLKWKEEENGCRRFHLMPRFVRDLPGKINNLKLAVIFL